MLTRSYQELCTTFFHLSYNIIPLNIFLLLTTTTPLSHFSLFLSFFSLTLSLLPSPPLSIPLSLPLSLSVCLSPLLSLLPPLPPFFHSIPPSHSPLHSFCYFIFLFPIHSTLPCGFSLPPSNIARVGLMSLSLYYYSAWFPPTTTQEHPVLFQLHLLPPSPVPPTLQLHPPTQTITVFTTLYSHFPSQTHTPPHLSPKQVTSIPAHVQSTPHGISANPSGINNNNNNQDNPTYGNHAHLNYSPTTTYLQDLLISDPHTHTHTTAPLSSAPSPPHQPPIR